MDCILACFINGKQLFFFFLKHLQMGGLLRCTLLRYPFTSFFLSLVSLLAAECVRQAFFSFFFLTKKISASLTPVTLCLSQPSVHGVRFVNALHLLRRCQIGSETPS